MTPRRSSPWRGIALIAALVFAAAPAMAQEFYRGKTIDFVIGSAPGGGYDIYARVLARHMAKHITGNPDIIARNMPGAGSRRAATHIYAVAAKDGLSIGAVFSGAVIDPLFTGIEAARYDPAKFVYLGSANNETSLCVTRMGARVATLGDALAHEAILGASQTGGSTRDFALLLNNTIGAKFKVVSGYPGTREITLAVDRGEVDGLCGYHWSSLVAQKPDWLAERKINILVQFGDKGHPDAHRLGVPMLAGFLKTDADRRAVDLVLGQLVVGRPFVLPPDTPADRAALLRQAFDSTMKDPAFLAEATQAKLDIEPASGAAVQSLVERLYRAPPEIVARAAQAIGVRN